MLNWSHHFESFTVATLTWSDPFVVIMNNKISLNHLVNRYGVSVSQMTTWYIPFVVITSRSFPHSWLTTGFVIRVIRWVPHVDHELLTLPENPILPRPIFYLSLWSSCCWCCQITCVHVFRSMLWCPLQNDVRFILNAICLWGLMFYVFYLYLFTSTGVQQDSI